MFTVNRVSRLDFICQLKSLMLTSIITAVRLFVKAKLPTSIMN